MTSDTMSAELSQPTTEAAPCLFDDWFDPIEAGLRERAREFIAELIHVPRLRDRNSPLGDFGRRLVLLRRRGPSHR